MTSEPSAAALSLPADPSISEEELAKVDAANLMQYGRAMVITAQVFGTSLYAATFVAAWGDTRLMWIAVIFWVVATVGNLSINLLPQRQGYDLGQTLRNAMNLVLHIPLCVLSEWNLVSWLWVPFFSVISAIPPARQVLQRVLLFLVAFSGTALFTGGHWQDAAAFSAISLFFFFAGQSYFHLIGNLMRERDRNLRELHEAHRRALTQEKLASVGQIAAGVAHEINNPMCFVTANVEMLLGDLQGERELSGPLAEYRDDILPETIDGIRRVNSIVDDLRRFARGEPDRFVAFDLSVELAAAARMARTQMKPGQALELDIPDRLEMTGAPRQLCQVVLNLLMNAQQALPEAGTVWLSVAAAGGGVEIAVRDNGSGMSEETRRRLFEPFFTTKTHEGVGLGLSVVYGIVKAHGGSIEVESALGEGSSFRMRLPRRAQARPRATLPPTFASARPPADPPSPGAA